MAKLTAGLPKGEANGLSALDRELIDSPSTVHEVRTGKTVLPFDLEEDMRAAFEGIDPSTGEILG